MMAAVRGPRQVSSLRTTAVRASVSSPLVSLLSSSSPSPLRQPRRHSTGVYATGELWGIPYGATAYATTKEELDQQRYFTDRPRDKWDYQRIDDNINSQSTYRRTAGREAFFQGMRADNSTLNEGTTHTPHQYNLYDHFDEYTQPGVNTKWAAVEAVKEQWAADEFYYPGEAWRRNRPGFRGVPQELLNRQTWYHWSERLTKMHEIMPTAQPRAWNPSWPPPGYRMPEFRTTHEYEFGGDDAALLAEFDRYTWYRSWIDNNLRVGWYELLPLLGSSLIAWWVVRVLRSVQVKNEMAENVYYPGKTLVRPWGVPRDWDTGVFWWQRPLSEFPNQSMVWYLHEVRFKYINLIKQRDAREQALAAAEEAAAAAAGGGGAAGGEHDAVAA